MAQLDKIRVSGTTYDILDSTALHTLDSTVTSGGTNAVKGSGIYNAITASTAAALQTVSEAGYQTSSDVQTATSGYADSVKYDSNSKEMKFYHGGTGGTEVFSFDASPFLIDGMVDNVEIKDVTLSGESVTCLVITFNTDAGKQEIDIPISQIFDASNYYTKAETDAAISAATSGKQDTLIAGNGITIDSANTISVTASTTVDQTIISGSTNAVAGGAVYDGLALKNPMVTLDGTTLVIS